MACCDLRLGIFDPKFQTILAVDASDYGAGGVLCQIQYNKEIPIAFGHHTFSPRERGWAVNEREAFAAMYFCEYFEKYLLGRPFILRSDHQPLSGILQNAHNRRKSAKFGRWMDRLSEFDFTIQYQSGVNNVVPDAISRLLDSSTETDKEEQLQRLRKINEEGFSAKIFKDATSSDPLLQQVCKFITNGWPNSLKDSSQDLQQLCKLRHELAIENGYIIRGEKNGILVPQSLRRDLLKKAHQGHP